MKQFQLAVKQIREMQSELDRLADLEQGVRQLADEIDDPDHPYGFANGEEIRALLNKDDNQ